MIEQRVEELGQLKWGNYAASLLPGAEAHEKEFSDCIYLDPYTHTKIEEVGAANFFGITKDGTLLRRNQRLFCQVLLNIHY